MAKIPERERLWKNIAEFSSTQGNRDAQEWLFTKPLISFLLLAQVRYEETKLNATIHGQRNWVITRQRQKVCSDVSLNHWLVYCNKFFFLHILSLYSSHNILPKGTHFNSVWSRIASWGGNVSQSTIFRGTFLFSGGGSLYIFLF